jgi:hypothetical protein
MGVAALTGAAAGTFGAGVGFASREAAAALT